LSDDFLEFNQFSSELEPNISYLLCRAPTPDSGFDLPSVPTPDIPKTYSYCSKDSTWYKLPIRPYILTSTSHNQNKFHQQSHLPLNFGDSVMERLASCRKFGGYPHENASQFIAEFESYATLHYIKLCEDSRKIAAFHLHLSGPALTWFNIWLI
jgi:hypothetical protein